VRLGLLLAEIGRMEEIEVTEQEMGQAIMRQSQQYPGQEREFFDFVKQNRQMLESIRAPIFEDKVVDKILEKAQVSDVTVTKDDLQKELETLDDET
ncbi:MAG: trigger factor, partial [Pseudomonadota bacterium]